MSNRLAQTAARSAPKRRAPDVRTAGARPNRLHSFLKRLHAGGRSNMYGAIPYLMHAFGLDREAAFRAVCEWVDQQAVEAAHGDAASSTR